MRLAGLALRPMAPPKNPPLTRSGASTNPMRTVQARISGSRAWSMRIWER